MTRDEALTLYRPIRAGIKRILSAALSACNKADWTRAAKQLGIWENGAIVLPQGDQAAEMLSDIALFEPNQRKRRAFDQFLVDKAPQLDAVDYELARRMGKAFFSLFRCAAKHWTAGVCLEDLIDGDRRIWLMDESVEASARVGLIFGMRLFDAGAFHVGLGIAVPADEETTKIAIHGRTRDGRLSLRHSLAVTLYGDSLSPDLPLSPGQEDAFTLMLARALDSGGNLRGSARGRSASRRARAREHK